MIKILPPLTPYVFAAQCLRRGTT